MNRFVAVLFLFLCPGLSYADRSLSTECNGLTPTIMGTDRDDVIEGTPSNDVIHGLSGNDTIRGSRGNDVICGGEGSDEIWLGPGNDTAFGGSGNDSIYGGSGHDEINGGNDSDLLYGQEGLDTLNGGPGNDELIGGCTRGYTPHHPRPADPPGCSEQQDDTDSLSGNQGNDVLSGGRGNDELSGGEDDDRLYGDGGNDLMLGETGNDLLYGEDGRDILSCGEGFDRVNGGDERGDRHLDGKIDCEKVANVNGFALDRTPLPAPLASLHSFNTQKPNSGLRFSILGNVPCKKKPKIKLIGSDFTTMLEYHESCSRFKPGYVETAHASCAKLFPQGVLDSIEIRSESRNKWISIRLACRNMKANGGKDTQVLMTRYLFNFGQSGRLDIATIPRKRLATGLSEPSGGGNKLDPIKVIYAPADAIVTAAETLRPTRREKYTSPAIPNHRESFLNTTVGREGMLSCPLGKVLSGITVGHIPDDDARWTAPYLFLGECRTLVNTESGHN